MWTLIRRQCWRTKSSFHSSFYNETICGCNQPQRRWCWGIKHQAVQKKKKKGLSYFSLEINIQNAVIATEVHFNVLFWIAVDYFIQWIPWMQYFLELEYEISRKYVMKRPGHWVMPHDTSTHTDVCKDVQVPHDNLIIRIYVKELWWLHFYTISF